MIIINGELEDSKSLILDQGYQFARGVFETILVRDEALFLKEHCDRLHMGLQFLSIASSIDETYIRNIIDKFQIKNCVLKIIVSQENIVFTTRESNYSAKDYLTGFKVKMSTVMRNESSPLTYIKSLNYLDNLIEREKALREGYQEVLFLNSRRELTEGAISNLFFVKNNKIYTPKVECGLLDGVVRKWIISNFNLDEGTYFYDRLEIADEIFLTNSVIGIMRVSSINDREFREGKVVEEIGRKYQEFIGQVRRRLNN